ncbi:MAG: hypothetical protein ACYDAD_15675 [Acidimicrobiales bacterium]
MDVYDFVQRMGHLSASDVRLVVEQIELHLASAADDVEWWQATLAIDGVLRRSGRLRDAAAAASSAARAVMAGSGASEPKKPGEDYLRVARAAGLVARGLVAGEAARGPVDHLLRDFAPLLARQRQGRAPAA